MGYAAGLLVSDRVVGRGQVLGAATWHRFLGADPAAITGGIATDGVVAITGGYPVGSFGAGGAGNPNNPGAFRLNPGSAWEPRLNFGTSGVIRARTRGSRFLFVGERQGAGTPPYASFSDDGGNTLTPINGLGDNTRDIWALVDNGAVWCAGCRRDAAAGPLFFTSADNGMTWTPRAVIDFPFVGPAGIVHDMCLDPSAPGRMWCCGYNNGIAFSDNNGVNWTIVPQAQIGGPAVNILGIAANGIVVAAVGDSIGGGQSKIVTSPDTAIWTQRANTQAAGLFSIEVLPGSKRFLAVGGTKPDGTAYAVLGSPDGVTWTEIPLPFHTQTTQVTRLGRRIYVTGFGGVVSWSDNFQ